MLTLLLFARCLLCNIYTCGCVELIPRSSLEGQNLYFLYKKKITKGDILGHSMWWRLGPTVEHQENLVVGCLVQAAGSFRTRAQLESTGPGDSWGKSILNVCRNWSLTSQTIAEAIDTLAGEQWCFHRLPGITSILLTYWIMSPTFREDFPLLVTALHDNGRWKRISL